MPLNNQKPARNDLFQDIQYLRARIQYTGALTTIQLGRLPAGAIILPQVSGINVQTPFNAGTTNQASIGIVGATGKFSANASLATAGFVALNTTGAGWRVDVDTDVIITMNLAGTAATAGDINVLIAFATPN